ncbi:MAG: hypothetical protein WA209_18005 [Candidatus Acidiferrales bacterium]
MRRFDLNRLSSSAVYRTIVALLSLFLGISSGLFLAGFCGGLSTQRFGPDSEQLVRGAIHRLAFGGFVSVVAHFTGALEYGCLGLSNPERHFCEIRFVAREFVQVLPRIGRWIGARWQCRLLLAPVWRAVARLRAPRPSMLLEHKSRNCSLLHSLIRPIPAQCLRTKSFL